MGSFVDGLCSRKRRWAVRGIGSEERVTNCVDNYGEDGENEGDESPARAEGGDDHGGRRIEQVMKHSFGAPSVLNP